MDYDVQCKYQYMFCATFYKLIRYVTANSQKIFWPILVNNEFLETLRIGLQDKISLCWDISFFINHSQAQTLCCGRYSALMFVLRFSVYRLQYTCGLPHNTNTQYNVPWILWYWSVWLVSKKFLHNIIIHNPLGIKNPTMNPLGHVHMYAYSTHVRCFQRVSCHWVPVSVRASPRGGRSFWHSQQSHSARPEHWHWPVQGEETLR